MNRITKSKSNRAVFLIAFSSLLLLYGTGTLAGTPDPASVAQALNQAFIEAVNAARPAVVYVTTERKISLPQGLENFPHFFRQNPEESPFGQPEPKMPSPRTRPRREVGVGSGFIIDKENHIITNHHVIDGAEMITVKLSDGREFKAEVVGSDPSTDIALLQVKDKVDLPVAKLGDSDKLQIGEWVLAIGNPMGLDLSVSAGIVSALGRANIGIEDYENFIQTDAAINLGNSGGPLVSLRGEVIGINTAIVSRGGGNDGIGFAIPINAAKWISEQFLTKGKLSRGYLGIQIQDITPELAEQFGVRPGEGALVAQVIPGLAAEKAGVKPGDVVLTVDGKTVRGVRMLRYLISQTPPGTTVALDILRGGEKLTLKVALGELEGKQVFAQDKDADFGMNLQGLTPDLAKQLDLRVIEGVLVADVEAGSLAEQAGLNKNSVITEVNRKPVKTVQEYREAVRAREKDTVLLLVQEAEGTRYVVIKVK